LKGKITDEVKQELYALSQQGSIGDVNTERPGFYQISARPLWDAWNSKKGMSKVDAMSSYIKIVKTYI
jgi:diazepam-binding inhibitor (GABA receptor modulating acyl-CoA-binding protein)